MRFLKIMQLTRTPASEEGTLYTNGAEVGNASTTITKVLTCKK